MINKVHTIIVILSVISVPFNYYALGLPNVNSSDEGERVTDTLSVLIGYTVFEKEWRNKIDPYTFTENETNPEYQDSYFKYVFAVASARASAQGRTLPNNDDIEITFGFLCNLPIWPKKPEDKENIRKTRKKIVNELMSTGTLNTEYVVYSELFYLGTKEEIIAGVKSEGIKALAVIPSNSPRYAPHKIDTRKIDEAIAAIDDLAGKYEVCKFKIDVAYTHLSEIATAHGITDVLSDPTKISSLKDQLTNEEKEIIKADTEALATVPAEIGSLTNDISVLSKKTIPAAITDIANQISMNPLVAADLTKKMDELKAGTAALDRFAKDGPALEKSANNLAATLSGIL